ncbi:MAG TPA: FHA domain-containing protein, partial [Pseudomonadota bacterium]|nr:FHA domain-containing protein [Pseudomonadota bacterium]
MSPPGPGGGGMGGGGGAAAGGTGGAVGAPPGGKYAILRVISGNDQGKTFELKHTSTTIGRGADQMVIVADIAVSRKHLQIHMSGNGYRMQDMGSPNGSMVNGKRQAEGQLVDNDQIEIGNTTMRFEHSPSRAQAEPVPQPMQQPMMQQPMMPQPMMQQPMMPQPMMQQPMMPQPMGSYAGQPPMGYPPSGYPQPGFAPQPGMPPALSPPTSAVASPPMMTGTPASLQSQSMSMGGEGAAGGPLAFLSDSRKRTLYLGAIAGALVVGGIGLILTSALRSSGGGKALDAVMDQYVTGTKNFTAGHYDDAKKAFQAAAEKAPDSTVLKRYIELCDSEAKMAAALDAAKRALDKRSYADALKEFEKVPKDSTLYEDAQQQARLARREAIKALVSEANSLAKSDTSGALDRVRQGLEIDPESSETDEPALPKGTR